jgi:hypothetical protein
MLSIEVLEKYEKDITQLDKSNIITPSKNTIAINSGIKGEAKVFEILKKFSQKIYRSVVIWNSEQTFTTEVDFIALINGYCVLIEAKEWFGVMDNHPDASKIFLSQVNFDGKLFKQERTSPLAAVGGFSRDLIGFLKNQFPLKKTQLKKIVVFTRKELLIKGNFTYSKVILCHLDSLEKELLIIKNSANDNAYELNTSLPSWDYYFDVKSECWYKIVVTSKYIETSAGVLHQSDVSSILFDDVDLDNAMIRLKSNEIINTKVNRQSIIINSMIKFAQNRVRFLKFDLDLHSAVQTIKKT